MPAPWKRLAVVALAAAGGCRSVSTSYTPGALWQPGAPTLVLPARAGTFDADIADTVAARLRHLGGVRVLGAPPGLVDAADDVGRSCGIARQAGARYLVLARGDMTASRKANCFLSTGILKSIVIPIVIPLPLPGRRIAILKGTIENPLGIDGSCVVKAADTWTWGKSARATVYDTRTCTATGGTLYATDGQTDTAEEPTWDLEVLHWQIRRDAPDLFPSQSVVKHADGGRGVAVPSRGIDSGEVFELRKPAHPDWRAPRDRLAYVRDTDGDQISVEPYGGPIDLAPGDVLIRRGRISWAELSPFASASLLSIDDDHALLAGGGGRIRLAWRSLLFGISGEYLRTQDRDLLTTSLFNFGFEGGVIRHVARRLDAYALLSSGATLASSTEPDSGGAAGYLASNLGLKLTLGRLFIDAELGAIYSTRYGDQNDHDVHQRGPFARLSLGLTFWPAPVAPLDASVITGD